MTTLDVALTLPDQLAQAGQQLLDAMQQLRDAPGPPLSEADIAAAVTAARRARGEAGHESEGVLNMTAIQIELPEATAQAARAAGLLTPQALARLLDEALKSKTA